MPLSNKQISDVYIGCVTLGKHELSVWEEVDNNIIALESLVEAYEKSKKLIIDKYTVKDDAGKPKLKEGGLYYDFGANEEKAIKLLTTLSEKKIEVDIYQFDKSELKGVKLSPNLLRPLRNVVVLGYEEKPAITDKEIEKSLEELQEEKEQPKKKAR